MAERSMYSDGYLRVGDNADIMDAQISIDEANALRASVITDLFSPLDGKAHKMHLIPQDTEECLGYVAFSGTRTRSIPTADFVHEPSIFIGAHLRQFPNNRWHLKMTHNRTSKVDDGMSEQRLRTFFQVVCWGDQVVEATRTVKLIKVTPALIAVGGKLTDKLMTAKPYYKRVGFTAPLVPEDCQDMAKIMIRHRKRVQHER